MCQRRKMHGLDIALVHLACGRIAGLARAIADAHRFGTAEGTIDEPWTAEFHRKAVHIFDLSLPRSYQRDIGALFQRSADIMDACSIPSSLAGDWLITRTHMVEASRHIFECLAPKESDEPVPPIDAVIPTVARFDLLAGLITRQGATRLERAALAVQRHMDTLQHATATSPVVELNANERLLLASVASGLPIAAVAEELGYSQRSVYRSLSRIWRKLGVENRVQGIRKAIADGLLV